MKKILAALLTLSMILSMTGCQAKEGTEQAGGNTSSTGTSAKKDEFSGPKVKPLSPTGTIAETVLCDKNGVKVTATGINYTNYSAEISFNIENNGNKDIKIFAGAGGYACSAVNNYMIPDGYMVCDVPAGQSLQQDASIGFGQLYLCGVKDIADIDFGILVEDSDKNTIFKGATQLKTSIYDSYDMSGESFIKAMTDKGVQNSYKFRVHKKGEKDIYEQMGLKVVSYAVIENVDGDTVLFTEVENTSSETMYMVLRNASVNGTLMKEGYCDSENVLPGHRTVLSIGISDYFEDSGTEFNIKDLDNVSFNVTIKDEEYRDLYTDDVLNINF